MRAEQEKIITEKEKIDIQCLKWGSNYDSPTLQPAGTKSLGHRKMDSTQTTRLDFHSTLTMFP